MIKQITVNENGVVTGVSIGGFISGGINVGDIPREVVLCPEKWIYKDGGFAANPNYAPSEEVEGITTDELAAAIAELAEIVGGN